MSTIPLTLSPPFLYSSLPHISLPSYLPPLSYPYIYPSISCLSPFLSSPHLPTCTQVHLLFPLFFLHSSLPHISIPLCLYPHIYPLSCLIIFFSLSSHLLICLLPSSFLLLYTTLLSPPLGSPHLFSLSSLFPSLRIFTSPLISAAFGTSFLLSCSPSPYVSSCLPLSHLPFDLFLFPPLSFSLCFPSCLTAPLSPLSICLLYHPLFVLPPLSSPSFPSSASLSVSPPLVFPSPLFAPLHFPLPLISLPLLCFPSPCVPSCLASPCLPCPLKVSPLPASHLVSLPLFPSLMFPLLYPSVAGFPLTPTRAP